jgi:Spy/CpxP family protein refolding chaperone
MKTRLTNTILIVMLLLNLAFIGSWWMMHMKAHDKMRHDNAGFHNMQDKGMMFLTDRLNFDDTQKAQAEKIFSGHADKMRKYQAEIGRLQNNIVKCMAQDIPDSVHAFIYADSVGIWRIAAQKEMFRGSIAIRQICNTEQKRKFDELMQNMSKRLGHQWDNHMGPMKHDSM